MNAKKGLLAAATATTVAIAGTGIASAADTTDDNSETPGSIESSNSGESFGSLPTGDDDGEFGGLLGSMEDATAILEIVNDFGGAVSGSISILPDIYSAVQDFQDMVDDISENLPPLPGFPA